MGELVLLEDARRRRAARSCPPRVLVANAGGRPVRRFGALTREDMHVLRALPDEASREFEAFARAQRESDELERKHAVALGDHNLEAIVVARQGEAFAGPGGGRRRRTTTDPEAA